MSQTNGPLTLAPTGTTGNNTGAGVNVAPGADIVALQFVVEVAGATPTVTYKLQGSLDAKDNVADGAANWFDLIAIPSDSDTAAVPQTVTAVGVKTTYVAQAHSRAIRRVRLVTSANTNITYRGELYTRTK